MAGLSNVKNLSNEENDVTLPEPEKPGLTQVGRNIRAYFSEDQPVQPAQSRDSQPPKPEDRKVEPVKPVEKPKPQSEPVPDEKHQVVVNSMNHLINSLKIAPHAAAAILGNAAHESDWFRNLDEDKSKYTKGKGGYGWMQWTDNQWEPRRSNFMAYAKTNNLHPASDRANLGFLKEDLKNNPRYVASIKGAGDVDSATEHFMNSYERPKAEVAHLDRRQAKARGILQLYKKHEPTRIASR